MTHLPVRSSVLIAGVVAALVAASTLSSRAAGVQSGTNSVPANCSKVLPSCSSCHSGSAPAAGRTAAPTTTLTVAKRALALGEAISVTTTATGGLSGTTGGFLCEATTGAFTPGANSRIITNSASITHANSSARTWSYTYTAPNTPGPVSLTACAMTSSGSSSGGDRFSFHGFDNNALVATPVRLYVLPTGVTNVGAACADGYGNQSVLGANSTPTVGNAGFAFELIGASPGTLGFVLAGFNPPGFTSLDLGALFGLTGCSGYVASPVNTVSTFTSAGSAVMAEGTATFPLPLPNNAALHGVNMDVQGACFDNSVATTRSMPISFSNGLRVSIP